MTHCHISSRAGLQFCNPVQLFLQFKAQKVMMDLPPQCVPTTVNHWTSKAILILFMSLHSKAFQQSPTAELILSPSPNPRRCTCLRSPQNLHLSPGSILSWYLVGSSSHATCSLSLCRQGQELFKRI